jgi:cullin 1
MTSIISLRDGWERLRTNGIEKLIRMIEQKDGDEKEFFLNEEYMALYTDSYSMCIQKAPNCFTSQLYDRYQETLNSYLDSRSYPAITGKSGKAMIQELVKRWESHNLMVDWMWKIFRYIDRFYVDRHNKSSLREVGLLQFRMLIFNRVKDATTASLLDLIKLDRDGEETDRDLLRAAIRIYVDMGQRLKRNNLNPSANTTVFDTSVYKDEFEADFILATKEYYSKESLSWLEEDSCPEYLRKAEQKIEAERKRLADYLHGCSEQKLMEALYETLLTNHQAAVLEKKDGGCKALLENNSSPDLARMFSLYNNIETSLPPIADILKAHILELGAGFLATANQAEAGPRGDPARAAYVEELMRIHTKYLDLVDTCFNNHTVFHKALKEAFESLVNRRVGQYATAELLSEYADSVLKKGGRRLDDVKLGEVMDNIVKLFSYLPDKDMFSEFYRKQLAKRLLLARSASEEAEKKMIGKLKMKCGAQFTTKLEGMINDIAQADSHQAQFNEAVAADEKEGKAPLGVDFSVLTLTTGFWPTYSMDTMTMPPLMTRCIERFQEYYSTTTDNRKLLWVHQLGNVTMTGYFNARPLNLIVSALQACILLLFNERESYTITEITQLIGVTPDVIKTNLRCLVAGKMKILSKTPANGFAVGHSMSVNREFQSPNRIIRVPNAITKTNQKERVKAHEAVREDRKHIIEASIVRIMKARKKLTHAQLMQEVMAQLSKLFVPETRQIKQRIADLINRDYLKRDPEVNNVYLYVA